MKKFDEWTAQKSFITAMGIKQRAPVNGIFELTPFCCFKCEMCYMRLDEDQVNRGNILSAKTWIDLGKQAQKAGTLFLLLTGGEPLLRPDFPEIYEELSKMGFLIKLYTNSALLTPKLRGLFERIPPSAVGITVYGASAETYGKVTGWKEGYDRTVEGLKFFKSLDRPVEIRTTLTKNNYDDFDKIRLMAKDSEMAFSFCSMPFKAVREARAKVEDVRLDVEQVMKLDEFVNSHLSDEERKEIGENKDEKFVKNAAMRCSAGRSSYSIMWDGRMSMCLLMDGPYTYPLKDGLLKAWEELREMPDKVEEPNECKGCKYAPYCGVCPAANRAETGSFTCVSDYICSYGKAMFEKSH